MYFSGGGGILVDINLAFKWIYTLESATCTTVDYMRDEMASTTKK